MTSQQATEEELLQEFLNEYYSEENFKKKFKVQKVEIRSQQQEEIQKGEK